MLYNIDGSVNRAFPIDQWDVTDQVLILKEMLTGVTADENKLRFELFQQMHNGIKMDANAGTADLAPEVNSAGLPSGSVLSLIDAVKLLLQKFDECEPTYEHALKYNTGSPKLVKLNANSATINDLSPIRRKSVVVSGRPLQGSAALLQKLIKTRRQQRAISLLNANDTAISNWELQGKPVTLASPDHSSTADREGVNLFDSEILLLSSQVSALCEIIPTIDTAKSSIADGTATVDSMMDDNQTISNYPLQIHEADYQLSQSKSLHAFLPSVSGAILRSLQQF